MRPKRICMVTTAHGPFDDRIFHKECKSLVKEGYEVTLIAQHDRSEVVDGIKIVPLPRAKSRLVRMGGFTLKALYLALKEKADAYHLHDPELLPAGFLLKILKRGKVIYDAHEDYEKKMMSKQWVRKGIRKVLSKIIAWSENTAGKTFDYIFAADSNIKNKFKSRNAEVIGNYPPLAFMTGTRKRDNGTLKVIYAGGIARERGSRVMMEAMDLLKDSAVELHLLGTFSDAGGIANYHPSEKVIYHGFVPWGEVNSYLGDADVGLVLLQPTPSYTNCTGEGIIKLFEYMSMKLPVVVSDFPLLRKLIAEPGYGICVDPTNPEKVAGAIKYLQRNPNLRKTMGEKGRRAVVEKYNWENESRKLLRAYRTVLADELFN